HSDTSGLTVTSGRPSGIGMVATLLAGYPAASAVGLAAAYLVAMGHSAGLLWLLVCGLAVMLLALRNLYGALVVLLAGTALAAASWFASPVLAVGLATLLAWTLLLAGPRPVIELLATRAPTSDAAQLARLTRVPRPVWILGWLALNTAALGLGGSWLLRPG
ncbi:MAG: M50 family metallopeptidase, partial [Propionicimonas sp.]